MKTSALNRKHGRSTIWGKEMFLFHLNESREGFCRRGRGRSFHVDRWTGNRKGAGTSRGESGARNMEAESIRSRAETTGGCVMLKTVTEIRWSSACDTFIAEGVYLVLEDVSQVTIFLIICSCIP